MINSIFYFYCSPKWKVNFRLSVTFSIRVRHCLQSLLICGALLCANTISAAENNTRKQVYTQALHAATADIAQTAKNKNEYFYSGRNQPL